MLNNDKYHIVVLGCDEGIGEAILGLSATSRDRRYKACRITTSVASCEYQIKRNQLSNIEDVEE